MSKNFKNEFKPKPSIMMATDLEELAEKYISKFTKEVKPVLLFCGLFDDNHIRRYMKSADMSEIYADAIEKDGARIALLEDFVTARGEDFWQQFRDPDCEVKAPYSDGFVFRPMPLWEIPTWQRDKVIRAIVVKDRRLSIDNRIIREESLVYPTKRMLELYAMVTAFCDELNAMKIKRKNILKWLLTYDRKGHVVPNEEGILWGEGTFH